jgi:anti-anti-sigma regulatory factor
VSSHPHSAVIRPGGEPPLSLHLDLARGRLTLTGALDRASTHLLYDAVSALLLTDQTRWSVDVTALTLGDRAAMHAIGAAYRRAVRHGRRLALTGASPSLRGHLTRVRLDQHVFEQNVVDQHVVELVDTKVPEPSPAAG